MGCDALRPVGLGNAQGRHCQVSPTFCPSSLCNQNSPLCMDLKFCSILILTHKVQRNELAYGNLSCPLPNLGSPTPPATSISKSWETSALNFTSYLGMEYVTAYWWLPCQQPPPPRSWVTTSPSSLTPATYTREESSRGSFR